MQTLTGAPWHFNTFLNFPIDIFRISSGLAIVGKNTWAITKARKKLKIEWVKKSEPINADSIVYEKELEKLKSKKSARVRKEGNPSKVFKNSKDIKDRGGLKIPNLVVQGGAGSGKSCVIDVLTQRMEKILRVSGGIPSHPYIVKAAFTGTAAANIDGQTMTSAFSFNFGNQFFSLSDKKRDEKREVLQNLVAVVIDEYSMIKADMLYQLDLRLREIKESEVPMGGVALFFFGDILQLRPVMARWIMEKPEHDHFQISYTLDPLWQKADVILLVKNHRQESDKQYADLLNRVRIGEQNDEDIELLKTRVRQDGHPDLP